MDQRKIPLTRPRLRKQDRKLVYNWTGQPGGRRGDVGNLKRSTSSRNWTGCALSKIIQATTAVASTETQHSGNLQPSVVEVPNPELAIGPVVLSTPLGGPADGHTETAKAGQLGPEAVRSPELTGGPLAHSTPLGKPAENLADSAKTEEAESETGSQLDKAARARLSTDQNGGNSHGLETPGSHRDMGVKSKTTIPESSRTASKRGRDSSGNPRVTP